MLSGSGSKEIFWETPSMAQEQKATAHRTTAAAIRLHLHPVMLEQRTLAWALHVLWLMCEVQILLWYVWGNMWSCIHGGMSWLKWTREFFVVRAQNDEVRWLTSWPDITAQSCFDHMVRALPCFYPAWERHFLPVNYCSCSLHEPQVACETSIVTIVLPVGTRGPSLTAQWKVYIRQICKATKLRLTGLPSLPPNLSNIKPRHSKLDMLRRYAKTCLWALGKSAAQLCQF